MEEEVTCIVCSELYTRGSREPVVLPLCGHTFCRPCLCNLENTGRLSCPTCRQTYVGPPIDQLPTVFALLSLSEHFKKSEVCVGADAVSRGPNSGSREQRSVERSESLEALSFCLFL